jgi:pyrroline-5-carboxylate reductase
MALKIALVGCGSMGSALLQGWLTLADSSERFEKFWVIAPHRESVEPFLGDSRVEWCSSHKGLESSPDVILFAIKPHILENLLPAYRAYESLFISVAAGKSLFFYQNILSSSLPFVRAMPNTPITIHRGVIGLLTQTQLTASHQRMVATCFEDLGFCLWVNSDDELDKLTALSGSGPAYVFALIEAFMHTAESLGFDKETSLALSLNIFLGASTFVSQSQESPSTLRQRVTSPQGTTAAGLRVLEAGGLNFLIDTAVRAAYTRAKELGDENSRT